MSKNQSIKIQEQQQIEYQQKKPNKYIEKLTLLLQTEIALDFIKNNQPQNQHQYNVSIFDKVFSTNLQEISFQIKFQENKIKKLKEIAKKNQNNHQYIENSVYKISELLEKSVKIKQFYIYCKFFKKIEEKKSSLSLQDSIERYLQYQKKQGNFVQSLKHQFSTHIVSDLIFKQYLKSYNVNIFTADLIQYYFFLNENNLLKNQKLIFEIQRVPELVQLQKKNIPFKQLCQISQKYSQIQDKLKNSYINFQEYLEQTNKTQQEVNYYSKNNVNTNNSSINEYRKTKMQTFSGYNKSISQKMKNLYGLIGKISMIDNNLVHQFQDKKTPVIVKEYESNFNFIKKSLESQESLKDSQQYKQFLCWVFSNKVDLNQATLQSRFKSQKTEESTQKNLQQNQNKPKVQFQFFKKKIIQIQTLVHLNRIISTLNLLSFICQQINGQECLGQEKQYEFELISYAISTQFRNQIKPKIFDEEQKNLNLKFECQDLKNKSNLSVDTDQNGCWIVTNSKNKKVIYPSSICNLLQFLKYLLHLSALLKKKGIFSQQIMLQILTLKAQQICKWGQIAYNIYKFTKSKQTNCYPLLKKYICLMTESFYINQLNQIQLIELSQVQKNQFQEELKNISQNTELIVKNQRTCTEQRLVILDQMNQAKINKFITHFALKAKKVDYISQIIFELDNNYDIYPVIKLLVSSQEYHNRTHYFQENVYFYQTVLYEIIQMRNNIKLDHYYSFPKIHQNFGFFTIKAKTFGQILNELAQASKDSIKIEELLRFFDIQIKLKRLIFKGQLYWTTNLSMSQEFKQSHQSFKQYVEQYGNQILSFSQKPMIFFLQNIDDFEKKVNLFERQIQRLKFCQVIAGKALLSKIKLKNLQANIKSLSYQELSQISKFLCSTNLIQEIFKDESCSNQLLSDIRMSIQINGKIKQQDISRTVNLIDEKIMLSDYMFFLKSFGFDLCYLDCMNIFQIKKLNPKGKANLKMLINRQKKGMLKHYNQALFEDKKAILMTISFYEKLILLSLIQMRSQFTNENDKQKILQILQSFSSYSIFGQLRQLKNYSSFATSTLQESLQNLMRQKMLLVKFQTDVMRKQLSPQFYKSKLIENLCLVSKISGVGQRKIALKIQNIYHQILLKQRGTTNHKISNQVSYLNNRLKHNFLKEMKAILISIPAQENWINILNNEKQIIEIIEELQKQLNKKLQKTSQLESQIYKSKKQLILFDQLRGYTIQLKDKNLAEKFGKKQKETIFKKNDRKNIKKGIFSPVRGIEQVHSNILQNIQRRVSIEMIKQSMPLRKIISQLELEDKKMRDQIVWETSKLQHNVIKKIHKFIAESNIDQQQSYLNFKHTVNLQTIKGMENVIQQQTQLYIKTTKLQKKILESQSKERDFFVTAQDQDHNIEDEQQNRLQYQNTRILNSNIESIFAHLKKIKVFAAWKKLNRNTNLTASEWQKFNQNVSNILHNNKNLKKIQEISQKRQNCFKENVFCCLLKEQNKMLSQKIRDQKILSLSNKMNEYRQKYCLGSQMEQA